MKHSIEDRMNQPPHHPKPPRRVIALLEPYGEPAYVTSHGDDTIDGVYDEGVLYFDENGNTPRITWAISETEHRDDDAVKVCDEGGGITEFGTAFRILAVGTVVP